MNVYQTRRTAWYPDWVLNNIKAHATKATLINDIGDGVKGAYGGTPFPIPKNGLEVLWNHFLYWQAPAQEGMSTGWLVDRSRNLTELSTTHVYYETPFYNQKNTQLDGPYYKLKSLSIAPARSVGEGNLLWYSIDYSQGGQKVWAYTPGQRRVRLAPEFTYDTPSASYGGALFYDEVFQFSGRPDRFDWKLIGKTEKYVPYNSYRLVNGTPEQAFSDKPYLNPDLQRWELHRVWEVEATVRAGERHAYSKRKFYFDEDTWRALLSTGYDQAGKLQRVSSQHCYQLYEQVVEGVKFQYPSCSNIYNDLPKDQYMITPLWGGKKGFLRATPMRPAADTQAGGLQGGGVR